MSWGNRAARVRFALTVGLPLLALLALPAFACGGSEPPLESLDQPIVPTLADPLSTSPTPGDTPTALTPSAVPPGENLNMIAYSDREGRVFVASPDAARRSGLIPTTASSAGPCGRHRATRWCFRIPEGSTALELHSYHLGDQRAKVIFTNEPRAGPILPNMAHYTLWAPDGSLMAMIANTEQMLSLFLFDPSGDDAELVLQQLPVSFVVGGLAAHGGERRRPALRRRHRRRAPGDGPRRPRVKLEVVPKN